MALVNLIAQKGEVDIVGAGWECQSISRGGRQEGYADRRFQYFYNLVRILGWLQHHQERSPVYFLENTYPGELAKMPESVQKTPWLIESFIGLGVVLDAGGLGAASHRLRYF